MVERCVAPSVVDHTNFAEELLHGTQGNGLDLGSLLDGEAVKNSLPSDSTRIGVVVFRTWVEGGVILEGSFPELAELGATAIKMAVKLLPVTFELGGIVQDSSEFAVVEMRLYAAPCGVVTGRIMNIPPVAVVLSLVTVVSVRSRYGG